MKWVFDNRWNVYIPLGTAKYSSYEDYRWKNSAEYHERERKRLAAHYKREKEQQEAAKLRQVKRECVAKKHEKITKKKAVSRQEKIQKLLSHGSYGQMEPYFHDRICKYRLLSNCMG